MSSAVQIGHIIQHLESIAPPALQEPYDNAGLIVGNPTTKCTGVLFCLDSTEAIIEEAEQNGCNLVIAHHPIVFKGLKRFNGKNYVERTVIQAIKNDIAIYAIHTNLDNVYYNGVNGKIASTLGLKNTKILAPKGDDPTIGAGMIGELPETMDEADFLAFLKLKMSAACVRHTSFLNKPIKRVALCGGSGSFLLQNALGAAADVYVTADFKYHEFFDADSKILIADIGHYESEQYTIELLHALVSEKFPNFALRLTTQNTNPVFYS